MKFNVIKFKYKFINKKQFYCMKMQRQLLTTVEIKYKISE